MKKSNFLNAIDYDEQIISSLYNKVELSINSDINLYGDYFYPPNVWKKLEEMNLPLIVESEGIFKESERRALKFSSFDNYSGKCKKEIVLIKIENKSKFRELSHKDYLGSLMSLGIKRETFGDLIVDDDSCYFPTFNDIADYIMINLTSASKNPIKIEILEKNSIKVSYNFKKYDIMVASFRIDAIVAKLCGVSRGKAVEIINRGEVLLNYLQVEDKDVIVTFPSIISIRKQGKYIIEKENGISKKDKKYLAIKKFI